MKERFRGKEPILEAIRDKRVLRTPEEHARLSLQSYVLLDWSAFKVMEKALGPEKATELHRAAWVMWTPELVNDSMKVLGIKEVDDIPTLGRVVRSVYDLLFCPVMVLEDAEDHFAAAIMMDPFAEYLSLSGEKVGSPYCKSVAEASKARLKEIVKYVGMGDEVKVEQDKFQVLGDLFGMVVLKSK